VEGCRGSSLSPPNVPSILLHHHHHHHHITRIPRSHIKAYPGSNVARVLARVHGGGGGLTMLRRCGACPSESTALAPAQRPASFNIHISTDLRAPHFRISLARVAWPRGSHELRQKRETRRWTMRAG
jgi:hypothetical protein